MRIPDRLLAQITERLDAAEVVSQYTRLEKRGGRYWGLCPFHTEKTPSFTVTPDKAVFYCFGCQKGGSLFTFVMEAEKLSFLEAVRLLAAKAGVELELEEDEDAGRRKAYLELYRRVAGSLHYILLNHQEAGAARAYLEGRGFRRETLERFQVGYAPPGRDWLFGFLREKSFSEEFLRTSGLFFSSREGGPVALFRDRVVFPIGNSRGEIVGFGGRSLAPERGPKYLNTPETAFFRKGELLFGEPGVFQAVRKEGRFVLVEGYLDVLACAQAGVGWALAPLGTALTTEQVRLLKRFAPAGVLAFDADEAGARAAQRAILMCEQADLAVEVAELAGGKDPAEILQSAGAEALHKTLKYPINSFQFLSRAARSRHNPGTPEGKKGIIAFLSPYLSSIDSPVKRDGYFRALAEELGVEFESVQEDFRRNTQRGAGAPRAAAPGPAVAGLTADFFFMLAVAAHRDYFAQVRNFIEPEHLEDARARKLFVAMEECFRAGEASEESLLARLEDPELRGEVLARTASGAFAEDPERLVRDGLKWVRRRALERRGAGVPARLAAPGGQEQTGQKDLLTEKMHIDEELAKLKKGKQG
ncbi:MAG: DNA primase [Spirochaetes bacterium RBG_16_67_19]|nr:MAG: DNA primase [Spirochaetes bacterium RBG_16_67_19]